MLALDLIDRRTMWRDYWIEWVLAAVLIAIDEWLQWRVAEAVGAAPEVSRMVLPLIISICVFPVFAWIVSRIDAGGSGDEACPLHHAHQSITFSRRMMLRGRRAGRHRRAADRPHGLAVRSRRTRNTSC